MQTIGERLEEARKRKGVSLREAAEATKIRSDYLQKLETNKFDLGLSPIYLRGFLRGYAHYLGLSADKLVNDFEDLDPNSARPGRSANREMYGRMEFGSGDTATPRAESSTPATDGAHKPSGHKPTPRALRPAPKHLGSLPIGDASSDRAMLFHLGKLVGGVTLVIVIAVWGLIALLGGKPKTAAVAPTATLTAPTALPPALANQAIIIALNDVRVRAWVKVADTINLGYGAELLPETTLKRGEFRTVPKLGAIRVFGSSPKDLLIDTGGVRYKVADHLAELNGRQYMTIP
jgi:cytoskeleton protein RodZ